MRPFKPTNQKKYHKYVPKILIANLPRNVSENDVIEVCLEYGSIDHIKLRWESLEEKKNMVAEVLYAAIPQGEFLISQIYLCSLALRAWKGLKTKVIHGRTPRIFTIYYEDWAINLIHK